MVGVVDEAVTSRAGAPFARRLQWDAMGLFLFLIILLAAAWGLAMQIEAPHPPPTPPVIQHATPKSDSSAGNAQSPAATVIQPNEAHAADTGGTDVSAKPSETQSAANE